EAAPLGDAERLGNVPRRVVAHPDVAHLAGSHAVVERIERLLERSERIEPVDLVQIDVIELQALEACIERMEDVVAREPELVDARTGCSEHLGRNDELISRETQIAESLAEHGLGASCR